MGYVVHHTIVCTSWSEEVIDKAHKKAKELFGELVTEIITSLVNGYQTFYVAPCGSKLGWPNYKAHEEAREEFKTWLKEQSLYIDAVEIEYGGDSEKDIISWIYRNEE